MRWALLAVALMAFVGSLYLLADQYGAAQRAPCHAAGSGLGVGHERYSKANGGTTRLRRYQPHLAHYISTNHSIGDASNDDRGSIILLGYEHERQTALHHQMDSGCSCATVTTDKKLIQPGEKVTLTLRTKTPPPKVSLFRQQQARDLSIWLEGQAKPLVMHYAFGLPLGTTSPVLSDGPNDILTPAV